MLLLPVFFVSLVFAEAEEESRPAQEIKPIPVRILPSAHKALASQLYSGKKGLFASGERGHIFYSSTGKIDDFQQLQTPARQYLTALTGDGDQRLWAVGHDSIILHSGDSGKTWQVQHFKVKWQKPLFDVLFIQKDEVIAVGAYGLYLRTLDGGKTWAEIMVNEEEPHFFDADLTPSGKVYLVGEFGTVMRCSSSGENPERIETDSDGTFFGIEVVGEDEWFGYGLRGRIYHFNKGESELLSNDSKASIFGSLPHKGGITFFGADGYLLNYSGGKTTAKSLPERVGITDGVVSGPDLILSTTEGFRVLRW
ncbi:hypothetical protein HOF92_06250 [bacterium]|nr:hypothetical protein [bacterium]